jgi:hypothetical protein
MLHFGVTAQPTSAWTAQQLTEGFPFKNPQSCVLHDRYGLYGDAFRERSKSLASKEVLTAPRRRQTGQRRHTASAPCDPKD